MSVDHHSDEEAQAPLLVLGVSRSYAGPHQVTYAGARRFWLRGHTGKYQPDVSELRHLFVSAASWLRQADEARSSRLELLGSRPRVNTTSVTLVHVLPLAPSDVLLDLRAHEAEINQGCPPLQHDGWSHRFNADGFMTFTQGHEDRKIISYTQWLRTGGVEGFSSELAGERDFGGPKPVKVVWLREMKAAIVEWVAKAAALLEKPLLVEPPYVVLITLRGILGGRIPNGHGGFSNHTFDDDVLLLPPVLLEPGKIELSSLLQPVFDTIAQSAGLAVAPS